MHIAILKFEARPPQQLPTWYLSAPILGYWISFKADIVSGSALLVPSSNGIEEIRRCPAPQEISVETGVKAYENFRLLQEAEPQVYRFEPLPSLGDYDLTGRISQVYTDDEGRVWAMHVWVGSCRFDFSSEHLNGDEVEEGAWVQFRVRELELFDENY